MNILFIKHIFLGLIVFEILRVSVFWHCPYSGIVLFGNFPICLTLLFFHLIIPSIVTL